jgi:glutaredoxin
LFQGLGVAAKVVELDDLADGAQVQEAIQALTGRRTVPQASVGGQVAAGWLCWGSAVGARRLWVATGAAGREADLCVA